VRQRAQVGALQSNRVARSVNTACCVTSPIRHSAGQAQSQCHPSGGPETCV
jgi:hypothetical protein